MKEIIRLMIAVIRFSHNTKCCVMLYYELHNSTQHRNSKMYRCEIRPQQNQIPPPPPPDGSTTVVSVGSPDY